jgi:hypothetical protein
VKAQETRPPRRRGPKWDPQFSGRDFTDGSNLYRFVEWLTLAGNVKLATMEDCRTLGLLLVSRDYLTKASPRPVPWTGAGISRPCQR